MPLRFILGFAAIAVFAYRLHDPKGSYPLIYDATAWLSALFVGNNGLPRMVRNGIDLVLLEQLEGFLLGIALVTLLSGAGRLFVLVARSLHAAARAVHLGRRTATRAFAPHRCRARHMLPHSNARPIGAVSGRKEDV